jgi:hypothetical protein
LHIDFLSWHLVRPVLVGVAQWRARLLVLRFYFCVEEYYLASTRQHSVRCVLVLLHGMFRDPDEGVRREDSLRNQRFFLLFRFHTTGNTGTAGATGTTATTGPTTALTTTTTIAGSTTIIGVTGTFYTAALQRLMPTATTASALQA